MNHFRGLLAEIAEPFAQAGVMHAEVGGLWLVFDGRKLVTVTPDKPGPAQTRRHDRHAVNGTHLDRTEQVHWKWKKRKGWK